MADKELRLKAAESWRDLSLAETELNFRLETYRVEESLFHPREIRAAIQRFFATEEAARTVGIYRKEELSHSERLMLQVICQIVDECYG